MKLTEAIGFLKSIVDGVKAHSAGVEAPIKFTGAHSFISKVESGLEPKASEVKAALDVLGGYYMATRELSKHPEGNEETEEDGLFAMRVAAFLDNYYNQGGSHDQK